jgi:phosphatidylglycerol---prolipoprotein diacylglyceryl transferase
MFPILQIWHVAIQTPGLILLLGFWLAWEMAERFSRRLNLTAPWANTLVTLGLVTAVIGGRLAYAAENWSAFMASPVSLVSLNLSLWDPLGGSLLGLAVCLAYGQRHKIDFWAWLDSLSPSFAVMMIALELANLASGSAFGAPAQLPWSIYLWGAWRHPSQIYETLGASGVLIWVIWRLTRLAPTQLPQPVAGFFFLEFVAWSAALRIFLEAFRGDSILLLDQFREAQIVAWVSLALSLFLRWKRSAITPPPDTQELIPEPNQPRQT